MHDENSEPWLSERQRKTLAAGLTVLATTLILTFVLALGWVLMRFFDVFSGVLFPLVLALILALVFRPLYDLYRVRLGWAPVLSVAAFYLTILIPVGLFVTFLGGKVYGQAADLLTQLPDLIERVSASVQEKAPALREAYVAYGVQERLESVVGEGGVVAYAASGAVQFATTALGNLAGLLTGLLSFAIMPIYLAFFLMTPKFDPHVFESQLPFLKAQTRKDLLYLVQEFFGILVSFFRGQMLIALIQGLLYAVGFSAVGLQYGFLIGFTLGILNIVPYLGNMVGLAVALPMSFFQADGGIGLLGLVLGVFVTVQMVEAYYLTPKIMGDRTGLHPLAIIFAIFFWGTALSGLAGMILAIPLTAFFVVFWRLARERYIPEMI